MGINSTETLSAAESLDDSERNENSKELIDSISDIIVNGDGTTTSDQFNTLYREYNGRDNINYISLICLLAKRYGIYISLGGFPEATSNGEKMFNTHLMINPSGVIISIYRKLHLFDSPLAGINIIYTI